MRAHPEQISSVTSRSCGASAHGGLITRPPAAKRNAQRILDTWLAILLSAGRHRATAHIRDTTAIRSKPCPFFAMLIALALSTQAQSLFGLDYGSGTTLCRIVPLRGWQILLAKRYRVARSPVTDCLIAPLSMIPALAFGACCTALAIWTPLVGNSCACRRSDGASRAGDCFPQGALQVLVRGIGLLGFAEMRQTGLPCLLLCSMVALYTLISPRSGFTDARAPGRY